MTAFFYRLTLDQAKQIVDDIDNNLLDPSKLRSHNVVPTVPATELTLGMILTAAAGAKGSDYIISLVTDENNTMMEPDLAAVNKALVSLDSALNLTADGKIIFRYVAL